MCFINILTRVLGVASSNGVATPTPSSAVFLFVDDLVLFDKSVIVAGVPFLLDVLLTRAFRLTDEVDSRACIKPLGVSFSTADRFIITHQISIVNLPNFCSFFVSLYR